MMDDRDGDGMTTLQVTQEGEQRRDIAADILVDAVQTHKRIKDKQPRLQPGDGLVEPCAVGLEIEAEAGRGDHLDVEFGEADTGGDADALEAATDDMERVLGGIEQHATGARDREAAQTGDASGDGDGQIEGEEGFAAFRLAADDADGFFRPQPVDEPAPLLGAFGEAPRRLYRKLGHRRRRIGALVSFGAVTAYVSKNSVSSIWRASRCAAAANRSPAMIIRARGLPCA